MSHLILAHGGTTGLALELGLLLVPAVILFWLMRRSRSEADDEEERGADAEGSGERRGGPKAP